MSTKTGTKRDYTEWVDATYVSAGDSIRWREGARTVMADIWSDWGPREDVTLKIRISETKEGKPIKPGTLTTRKARVVYRGGVQRDLEFDLGYGRSVRYELERTVAAMFRTKYPDVPRASLALVNTILTLCEEDRKLDQDKVTKTVVRGYAQAVRRARVAK